MALISVIALAAMLIAGTATANAALVGNGYSGWQWSTPQPQGHTLNAVEFNGSGGYAAGSLGTLLHTTNGGESWQAISTGLTADLAAIETVGSNTVIVAGKCALRRSDNGGQTFRRLAWTPSDTECGSEIVAISFPDSNSGVLLLKDGSVLQTADGGATWSRRTRVPGTNPQDVEFQSASNGFAVGEDGRISRTTDGANSWTQVVATGSTLREIEFVSNSVAYAVGDRLAVYTSTDAGATWTGLPVSGVPGGNLTSIRCATTALCLASTAAGDQVIRTTDSGATWASITPSSQKIFAAGFASEARAVAVGDAGATATSSDGGVNWNSSSDRLQNDYTGFGAASPQLAWLYGKRGALALTTDGGQTVRTLGVPTPGDVYAATFVDAQNGYALDSSGSLFRTANGAVSWSLLNYGARGSFGRVIADGAQGVAIAGPTGVRRSINGGASFTPVSDRVLSNVKPGDYDGAPGGVLVGFNRSRIALSTNFGTSFREVNHPGVTSRMTKKQRSRTIRTSPIYSLDFYSGSGAYAVTTAGRDRLWKTANGGRTWTEIKTLIENNIASISFSNASSGYVVPASGTGGIVYRTSNGGANWTPEIVAPDQGVQVQSTGPASGFASTASFGDRAGEIDQLFVTSTGGTTGRSAALQLTTSRKTIKVKGRKVRVKVTINGKLTPSTGGDVVTLATQRGDGAWATQLVEVASDGTFTSEYTLRSTGTFNFAAGFNGGANVSGALSQRLAVTIKR